MLRFNPVIPKYLEWYSPSIDLEHTIQVCKGENCKLINPEKLSIMWMKPILLSSLVQYKLNSTYVSDSCDFIHDCTNVCLMYKIVIKHNKFLWQEA